MYCDAVAPPKSVARRNRSRVLRPMRRLVLLLSLFAAPAHAGPDRLSFLLGSRHIDAASAFQEVNPGVFLTWEDAAMNGSLDLTAGVFLNSYDRGAAALTLAFPVWEREDWQVDVFAGLAWYPEDGRRFRVSAGDIVPLAGLQARWRNLFVQAIPQDGVEADLVLSFGVTFALGE